MGLDHSYQRKHLRAPFKIEVLYTDEGQIFKAGSLNLSEQGILLTSHSHLPGENKDLPAMTQIPQYPYFKNFTLEKIKTYSSSLLPSKFIKFNFQVMRSFSNGNEGVRNMGTMITSIDGKDLLVISNYVAVFSSNLIYLLVLIDSLDTDKLNLDRVRTLADILGYDGSSKMALLRKRLEADYQSLQWL